VDFPPKLRQLFERDTQGILTANCGVNDNLEDYDNFKGILFNYLT